MRTLGTAILLSVVFLPFSAVNSGAIDRFVAVGGDDKGDCSDSAWPCGSIQYAISASSDKDIVYVNDGTYPEHITFQGKAITVRSFNGPKYTTVDGSGTASVVTFDNGEGPTSILDGFSIINGSATDGGGIYISVSSPTISDCTVSNNSADNGGGIYLYASTAAITHCTISDNSAMNGGGVYNDIPSSSTISNCTIRDNSATVMGGGVYSRGGLSIDGSTISGNSAGSNGGGIYNYQTSPTVTNSIISGNSASGGGGIYNNLQSSPTVTNSTISGNSATNGGGMSNYQSSPTVTNSTISGNSAATGGGIQNYQSSTALVNTILWGDAPDEFILFNSSTISIKYSDIQGGSGGLGNINADPLFIDPRPSSEAPTAAGDYHLQEGSPAIDAGTGDTSTYPTLPSGDIDGDERPQGMGFDMGSDEYMGGLWGKASALGGGWYWLDWFEYFNLNFDPWIYHMEHAFLYPFGTSTESVVFWDSTMSAFWWTSDSLYPYLYRFSDGEWLWYQKGTSGPRWFVRLSDGAWEEW